MLFSLILHKQKYKCGLCGVVDSEVKDANVGRNQVLVLVLKDEVVAKLNQRSALL